MNQILHPDGAEDLIDRALATYTAREADAGLEGRILACAAAERRRVHIGHWRWAMATAASLAMVVLFSFWLHWQHLEIAVVHRPAAPVAGRQTPTQREETSTPGAGVAQERGAQARTELQPSPSERQIALRTAGLPRPVAATPSAEPEMAESTEQFSPIVLKPIVIAPIRIDRSNQGSRQGSRQE